MAILQPRYSKKEFAQRGDRIYETQILPLVEADNHGKIVAIDIETAFNKFINSQNCYTIQFRATTIL